jgi:prolyl-tRNA synthetase
LFVRDPAGGPRDAEVASHRLLVRAGYIRRAAPGGFTFLPLGWIVYRNVERIVREEMDREGFQEVHFPALLPREPYEASNRWTDYGDSLFRLKDRRGNDMLLAPTHEEMFTLLVKDLYSSYKDLPLVIYQIQTKYRDEARPRAGLLRGREFVMKDSYSFDIDEDGLQTSYDRHRVAYQRTFDRLGLPYVIVSAMSGAMGGSASEEFLAPIDVGEDTFVRCTNCDYAANVEAVRVPVPEALPLDDLPAAVVHDTPDTPTIQTLVDHLNARPELARTGGPWTAAHTLKNVVVKLKNLDGTTEVLAVGLAGDRDVDMKRLEAQVAPAEIEPFSETDFAKLPQLVKGYIGPDVLGEEKSAGIRYLVDPRVVRGTSWVTGANEPGRHVVGLVYGRDFVADGTIEAAEVLPGDRCPTCGGELEIARGHRDRPHLPARAAVREGARPLRARPERQDGHGDDGLLRHRCDTSGRSRSPRRRATTAVCAGRASSRPPTSTSWRPARRPTRSSRPPSSSPPRWRPRGCACCSTTGLACPPASSSTTPT